MLLPESARAPSGDNATEEMEYPSKLRISALVAASHSLSIASAPPESTRASSGEKATEMTS